MGIENTIALGQEAEIFLDSTLGKILQERAEAEVAAAKDELVNVDPTDVARIIELQNIVVRYGSFKSWLMEIIVGGRNAYDEYVSSEE